MTRHNLLIVAATVLFVVGFLLSVGAIDGNPDAFLFGGLACFAGGHLP